MPGPAIILPIGCITSFGTLRFPPYAGGMPDYRATQDEQEEPAVGQDYYQDLYVGNPAPLKLRGTWRALLGLDGDAYPDLGTAISYLWSAYRLQQRAVLTVEQDVKGSTGFAVPARLTNPPIQLVPGTIGQMVVELTFALYGDFAAAG